MIKFQTEAPRSEYEGGVIDSGHQADFIKELFGTRQMQREIEKNPVDPVLHDQRKLEK